MDNQYMNSGEVAIIDSNTIEISELPVKAWTQVSLVFPLRDGFRIYSHPFLIPVCGLT